MVRVKQIILTFFIIFIGMTCFAEQADDNLVLGIEAYKQANYPVCIEKMKSIVNDDPTSVVAYYYLGLAYTKSGQNLLAVQNFNKVININSDSTLTTLARQGKKSIKSAESIEKQINEITEEIKSEETPNDTEEYNPIMNDGVTNNAGVRRSEKGDTKTSTKKNNNNVSQGSTQSPSAQQTSRVISAKDYQNTNSQPTNDDIVNAIRVLQKAGLLQNGAMGLTGGGNPYQQQMPMVDPKVQQMNAMLMMMNNGNNNNGYGNMMQMLPMMQNGGKVDPQIMQMMLMNQMMPNFSGGNNGGGY